LASGAFAQGTPADEEGDVEDEGDEMLDDASSDEGGMLLGVEFVFAKALGDAGDVIGLGLGGNVWGGYRIESGQVGIVPRLEFGYEKFLKKHDNGGSLITVMPGLVVDYRAGSVSPWLSFGLGMGSFYQDVNGALGRENKFALEFGGGVNYHVSETTAVAAYMAYDVVFTPQNSTKFFLLGAGPLFNF
jgi:hypothetical protein